MGDEVFGPLDLPVGRALVRLRFVLEHALGLTRDSSDPGAHVAIVVLDGAVEHALWLVTRAYGAEVKPTVARHELASKVRVALSDAGRQWRPLGAPGVDQLHRARNDAQHAAVRFDPDQLSDWGSAASAYIDSLVSTAFDRSIFEVALADTIRDSDLADLLRRAEADIGLGDAGAFQLVCFAFDEARKRWREQRVHIYGRLINEVMTHATQTEFGMLHGGISQDERLADFLEVVPFALDLGEYLWFVSARRQQQQETGWTPEPADTRRALVFVSGWIVRWEIFDRGYPMQRWNDYVEGLKPPVVGDAQRTEILDIQAVMTNEIPGHPARCHLYLHLANLPDDARGPWGNWLPQGLVDAAAELGENVRFDRVQLSLTGQLLLVCDLGYDPEALLKVIRRGIELTDQRYRDWNANQVARHHELSQLRDEFARVITSATSSLEVFGTIEVTERGSDGQPIVWVNLNFGESKFEELGLCVQALQSRGGVLASTGTLQNRIVFDAFELTPANEALLREAVTSAEEIVLHRRAYYGKRRLEFQRFQKRLKELLPQAD